MLKALRDKIYLKYLERKLAKAKAKIERSKVKPLYSIIMERG